MPRRSSLGAVALLILLASASCRGRGEPAALTTGVEGRVHGVATTARVCLVPTTHAGEFVATGARLRCVSVNPWASSYRIADVDPGVYWVSASARGVVPTYAWFGAPTRQTRRVVLARGQRVSGVDLYFDGPGVRVAGVVTDGAGVAVAGASVQSLASFTKTDAGGEFELWLDRGATELRVRARGYASATRAVSVPGPAVELALEPEAVLRGRVVLEQSGAPVADAAVSLTWGARDQPAAETGGDGRFEIRGLGSGRHQLFAITSEGFGASPEPITLAPGSITEPVVIRVSRAHTVTGRILTEDGAACADGRLTVRSLSHGQSLTVAAATNGTLSVRGLPTGRYGFTARCPGYRIEASLAHSIERSLDLEWSVTRGLAIVGRLVDAAGAPVAHARLSATSLGRQHELDAVWTGPGGEFAITGLYPARDYRVEAIGSPLVPVEVSVADEDVDVGTLRLAR
ncbi:hypothetical protein ENSA5_11830 [Enhygromyxa salina]|uniref:Carboxypeptidase regulatory-like domain-containing protein n=1 Tax=Enhygromyxa salina TaxID=215803 RepID=A0A2S9YFW6_9BACT|nr:carboxypeptidase regulatory-like domain-containing protein [Enhygromyxa salina]PRQ04000.1 hypothetical protein ENSA5_11830 [Enhygromyxa salina]